MQSRRAFGLAVYLVVALTIAAVLPGLQRRSAELTGLEHRVYADIGLCGEPLLRDVTSDLTLAFLDTHTELPRRFALVTGMARRRHDSRRTWASHGIHHTDARSPYHASSPA